MKRAATIMAAAVGTFLVSVPAFAADEVNASRILDSIYASLGMDEATTEVETSKNGFFVGIHSGLGAESGIAPAAAGLSIPLNMDVNPESITANGYYVFNTDFSLGTYVGGGFGRFNLGDDLLLNQSSLPRGNFAVQGMAGLTYAFTPGMVLGLEYRYSEAVQGNNLAQSPVATPGEQDQSVTLRFDFLLN